MPMTGGDVYIAENDEYIHDTLSVNFTYSLNPYALLVHDPTSGKLVYAQGNLVNAL